MSGNLDGYKAQIRVQNGVTYYMGTTYPDKDFFDAHWTYGNGSELVIPSSLVWDQISTKVPAISSLAAVEKILTTEATAIRCANSGTLIGCGRRQEAHQSSNQRHDRI